MYLDILIVFLFVYYYLFELLNVEPCREVCMYMYMYMYIQ